MRVHFYFVALVVAYLPQSQGFVTPGLRRGWGTIARHSPFGSRRFASTAAAAEDTVHDKTSDLDNPHQQQLLQSHQNHTSYAVQVPLKYIGPYATLALRFPHLSTSNQRARNESGVGLDFVLDTGANLNTINAEVAKELKLEQVGAALPGLSSSGFLKGGKTYMLGDTQLEGLGELNFTFMTGLTASALPIASPAAAGLLSLSFFQCFPGGVEFSWGSCRPGEEQDSLPPSITFFDESLDKDIFEGLQRVPVERFKITQLPSVTVKINGVEMPALLDTGSPVTVLNAEAARIAGIETVPNPVQSKNPFGFLTEGFRRAKAASTGDVLSVAGASGRFIDLLKSAHRVDVEVVGDNQSTVRFGTGHVFVGELPGLVALNGVEPHAAPAVVLGLDVLRLKPRMLLRMQQNEVWFG